MAEPRRDRPPPKKRRRDMTTEQLKNRAEKMPDTERAKAELFELHGGRCHITGRKIAAGEPWDKEHIIPISQFPAHRRHEAFFWRNYAPALVDPHRGKGGKSADDAATLAKSDRVRLKHLGLWKPKTPVRGSKNHPYGEKKKADGRTVRRDEDGPARMK